MRDGASTWCANDIKAGEGKERWIAVLESLSSYKLSAGLVENVGLIYIHSTLSEVY